MRPSSISKPRTSNTFPLRPGESPWGTSLDQPEVSRCPPLWGSFPASNEAHGVLPYSGSGKFGRLALGRLSDRDTTRPASWWSTGPAGLGPGCRPHLEVPRWWKPKPCHTWRAPCRPEPPWDWLIPMVPVHVAFAWLLEGALAGKGWEPVQVPAALEALAAVAVRGRRGTLPEPGSPPLSGRL